MSDLVKRTTMALVAAEPREVRVVHRQVAVVLAHENGEAHVRDQRIDNAYSLAHHTAVRATVLNGSNTELSHDNPALELDLRSLEKVVLVGAKALIADYLL